MPVVWCPVDSRLVTGSLYFDGMRLRLSDSTGTGLQIVYLARPDGALLYASLALKILVALDSTITSFRLFMSARRAARQDTQKALPKEEGEEATAPIARSLEAPLQTKGIAFVSFFLPSKEALN